VGPDEIGLALTLSRGGAVLRLEHAGLLAGVLDRTLTLLEQGRLDVST